VIVQRQTALLVSGAVPLADQVGAAAVELLTLIEASPLTRAQL
jgi:hypothetical protein